LVRRHDVQPLRVRRHTDSTTTLLPTVTRANPHIKLRSAHEDRRRAQRIPEWARISGSLRPAVHSTCCFRNDAHPSSLRSYRAYAKPFFGVVVARRTPLRSCGRQWPHRCRDVPSSIGGGEHGSGEHDGVQRGWVRTSELWRILRSRLLVCHLDCVWHWQDLPSYFVLRLPPLRA